ncbi:hypothetical protein [Liquorilactobacillus cacaonum]|uniref:hypothetical protein n=1 Tax=Liquorilactobacillus cacaonum TaxID=483012 RepID=UPI00070C8D39|nr:hypothetical protein [Liquorilactobacillus cacaonum]
MIFFWLPVSFNTKYSLIYGIIIVHFDYPFYRGLFLKALAATSAFLFLIIPKELHQKNHYFLW